MKNMTKWLSLLAILFFLTGCSVAANNMSGNSSRQGSIRLNLGASRLIQTLEPSVSMDAASYEVTGSGPNGDTFSFSSTDTVVVITNLAVGTWTVSIIAENADGTAIGSGSQSIDVAMGQTTTITISVTPLTGTGTLNLSAFWNAGDVDNPNLVVTLNSVSGTAYSPTVTISGSTATSITTNLPNGYYMLNISLYDGSALTMGTVEIVYIVANQTTYGTFAFTNINLNRGSVDFNVNLEMANPIPVSLTNDKSVYYDGDSLTLSAIVPATYSNLNYQWYVNGVAQGFYQYQSPKRDNRNNLCRQPYAIGTATNIINPISNGVYCFDVLVFSSDGSEAGSATETITVNPATN